MERKLPGVYANKIDKTFNNNTKVYYSQQSKEEKRITSIDNPFKTTDAERNILEKIDAIFASPTFVYKADVKIKLVNGTMNATIIARNDIHLITIENQLIPISSILDIELDDKKTAI